MADMTRYSVIDSGNSREIVLLKGRPCVWGKCTFCDYIADNTCDERDNYRLNSQVLDSVDGRFGALEVINSGSVFELDKDTLAYIRKVCNEKNIGKIYFECYYAYKNRLDEIRQYFGREIVFKCGIESFDEHFRNVVLNKNIHYKSIEEIKQYFQSVCIMVGVQGQTKEMIQRDIELLREHFEYGCVNVYCNNSTPIRQDKELVEWFFGRYDDWDRYPGIDVLAHNTDFGVGDEN